jgi:hypothetical protein
MDFADRAVSAFERAIEEGRLSNRHIRDVLKCENADTGCLSKHLYSTDSMVRRGVARVIGGGSKDLTPLLDAAMRERDPLVLREMISILGKRKSGALVIEGMIRSDDALVREEAISMLRRSGNAESLVPLLFDKDDALVSRIKRYLHEQKREQRPEGSSPGKPC